MAKQGPKPRTARTAGPATSGVPGPCWGPPGHLSDAAAAEFARLVGLLRAAGNLERTDPMMVELYATTADLLRRAMAEVDRDGPTLMTDRGSTYAHPMCAVINAASMRLKALINDLGLCPASSKYAATPTESAGPDRWGDLLNVVG
jgi:P27 family predicted phage terminase small subunit